MSNIIKFEPKKKNLKVVKLSELPKKHQKISVAPQDEVSSQTLEPYVNEILKTIGFKEALVTDESQLRDFGMFDDKSEDKLVKKIRRRFGITVSPRDTLVSIAERIRKSRQK